MTEDNTVIDLSNVSFFYPRQRGSFRKSGDKFWALRDVSFRVFEGEAVGIVGRNGAGKSTLLKLLAGITTPDCGVIRYRKDLKTTLLSIQAGFNLHLSGTDNAIMSGMLLGMSRKEVVNRLEHIAELADLGDFMDQPLYTYSTGMRARLGFATAYYTDCDIMLLDEILSVGDAKFKEVSGRLMEERINSHKTAILVSHAENIVRQLCHRLIWIESGRVRMDGDSDSVWQEYRQSFVARKT